MSNSSQFLRRRLQVVAGLLVAACGVSAVPLEARAEGRAEWVQRFDDTNDVQFEDARLVTVQGTLQDRGDADAGVPPTCSFSFPELSLPAGSRSVAARDKVIDLNTCTAIVEIGTPADTGDAGTTRSASSSGGTGDEDGVTAAHAPITTEGNFRIWFEDVANLSVSSVRAHIRGAYDGACLHNPYGWATDNYAATGWSQVYLSHFWERFDGCTSAHTQASGEHKNHTFCWPKTVQTTYPEVAIRLNQVGTLFGGNQFLAYVSHGGATWLPCPPLQRNASLNRDF